MLFRAAMVDFWQARSPQCSGGHIICIYPLPPPSSFSQDLDKTWVEALLLVYYDIVRCKNKTLKITSGKNCIFKNLLRNNSHFFINLITPAVTYFAGPASIAIIFNLNSFALFFTWSRIMRCSRNDKLSWATPCNRVTSLEQLSLAEFSVEWARPKAYENGPEYVLGIWIDWDPKVKIWAHF